MRIAIDLNDVIRAYSKTFAKFYKKETNSDINLDELELTSNNLDEIFDFNSKDDYQKFLYEDYPFEIFGSAPPMEKNLPAELNDWITKTIGNLDITESIDLIIVSPMEFGLTIQSTYFFLSKIGCRIREVYLPKDSLTIWDKCDCLITANPKLLNSKPDDKISIKINMLYNADCPSSYSYESLSEFISDKNNILKLINHE